MAVWPASLTITKENYSEKPANRVIRSEMDVGPAKIRRRSSAGVREVSFKMLLNDTQLDALEAFYDENDALAFDFTNPRTEETVRARFTEPPTFSLSETLWEVRVVLEVLP